MTSHDWYPLISPFTRTFHVWTILVAKSSRPSFPHRFHIPRKKKVPLVDGHPAKRRSSWRAAINLPSVSGLQFVQEASSARSHSHRQSWSWVNNWHPAGLNTYHLFTNVNLWACGARFYFRCVDYPMRPFRPFRTKKLTGVHFWLADLDRT